MSKYPSSLAKLGLDPGAPDDWPTALSASEFETRFPAETEVIEFKEGASKSALESDIVAFSNSGGGFILIGVRDGGEVKGMECTPDVTDEVKSVERESQSPGAVSVKPLRVDDREITVVGVSPLRERFAQTSSGRVLVRSGTSRVPLIGTDLANFIQERAASSFEDVTLGVGLASVTDERRRQVGRALGVAGLESSDEHLIETGLAARIGGEIRLTIVGALYLLEQPEAHLGKSYIEVLRYPLGSPNEDRRVEIMGPLDHQVERATSMVQEELGADEVVLGLKRHTLPRLPIRVTREAIANAVAHRSYEQRGTAVRVELHSDRVDVSSPGGLISPVTIERMRDQQAARNNKVIKLLRAFGLAEDRGKGIDMIQDTMRDELLAQPVFAATDASVTVTLPVLSGTSSEERAWVREVESRGRIEERDRVLLVHARRGEELSNQRARELLSASRDVAGAALTRLTDAGLLVRLGRRGGTRYRLADDLTPPAGLRLDRAELADMVLDLAKNGPVSNASIRRATGLDRQDALSLLNELVSKGHLARVGEKRGTKYMLAS